MIFYPGQGETDFADTTGYISADDVSRGAERFEWVRKAVGDALEVGIDLHAAFDVPERDSDCRGGATPENLTSSRSPSNPTISSR